jgi:hypothetical protein
VSWTVILTWRLGDTFLAGDAARPILALVTEDDEGAAFDGYLLGRSSGRFAICLAVRNIVWNGSGRAGVPAVRASAF